MTDWTERNRLYAAECAARPKSVAPAATPNLAVVGQQPEGQGQVMNEEQSRGYLDTGVAAALDQIEKWTGNLEKVDLLHAPMCQPGAITPFFAPGDFGLLIAAATGGKTTMSAQLICAALLPKLDGKVWGGAMQIKTDWFHGGPLGSQAKVAVIDAEDSKGRLEAKLKLYLESNGLGSPEAYQIISDRLVYLKPNQLGLNLKSADYCTAAAMKLKSEGVRLVIGDTQAAIFSPDDIRSDAWVYNTVMKLQGQLKLDNICTIMLAHHARASEGNSSPNKPLGSSQQENQADVVIKATRSGKDLTLEVRKSRRADWVMPGEKVLLTLPKTGLGYLLKRDPEETWPKEQPALMDSVEAAKMDILAGLTEGQKQALDLLKEAGEAGLADKTLSEAMDCDRSQAKKLGVKLVGLGLAVEVPAEGKTPRLWRAV